MARLCIPRRAPGQASCAWEHLPPGMPHSGGWPPSDVHCQVILCHPNFEGCARAVYQMHHIAGCRRLTLSSVHCSRAVMKRKAHTAFACEVCSRGGAPACFMSDADLARHKRSASHLQQRRIALAPQKYNSVASAPSPAAHADHGPSQVEHCPFTPCCSPVILEVPEYCALSEHLYADLVCMHAQALAGPQGDCRSQLAACTARSSSHAGTPWSTA